MVEPMLFLWRHTSHLRKGLRASPGRSGRASLVRAQEIGDLHKNCPDTHKTHGQVWSNVINGQEERPARFISLGGLPSGDMSLLPTLFMSPGGHDEGARRENGGRRVGD